MTSAEGLHSPIRVVIVAAVRLYREGLASSLLPYECLSVAGTASNRVDAKLMIPDLRPDVVVIDMAIPEALDLICDLRVQLPVVRLIAFAVEEDVSTIVGCAEAGATGYVTLNASIDDFVRAIERAAVGELACSPRIAAELFRSLRKRSEQSGLSAPGAGLLTNREQDVLVLITRGLSNKEISTKLNIAEATVKNHVHHLLEKLHVGSRMQAAAVLTFPPSQRRCSLASPPVRIP